MTWLDSDRLPESLLISAVFFGPLAFGAVEPWPLATLEIVFFALLALALLRNAGGAGQVLSRTIFIAVTFIAILGLLQCLNPHPLEKPASLVPFTAAARFSRKDCLLWTSYAALLWSTPQALPGRPALRRMAWVLLLVGALVAVIGIAQWGQGNNAYYGLRQVRHGDPFGPYVNRDHAASLMVMSFLVGLGLLSAHLTRTLREIGPGRLAEFFSLSLLMTFFVAVTMAGIWKTHSRGAINSLAGALWALCLLFSCRIISVWRRYLMRALLILIAAGYTLFLFRHAQAIGFIFGTPDFSTTYRLSIYRSGLRIVRDFPVFGVGLGAFRIVYPAYQETLVQGIVEYAHSDWLELAISSGLPVAVFFAGSLLLFLYRMSKLWLRCRSVEMLWISAGALTAIVAFSLHGLVEFTFQIPANAVFFLVLLSFLECSLRAEQNVAQPNFKSASDQDRGSWADLPGKPDRSCA